jgi:hypothetical protein
LAMTWAVAAYGEALLYRGAFWLLYIGVLWVGLLHSAGY